MIGYLVNLVGLRLPSSEPEDFGSLVAASRDEVLAAHAHRNVPFEPILARLAAERSAAGKDGIAPLRVTFAWVAAPPALSLPGLATSVEEIANGAAKFDLSLTATPAPEGLSIGIEYDAELFDCSTIARWADACERLLRSGLAEPEQAWGDLDLMSPADRDQLLLRAAGRRVDPTPEMSVIEEVERWSSCQTSAPAVVDGDVVRSYGELSARTNRWARVFEGLGVTAETVVALVLPRGIALVEAAMAVVKAGGAYLPIDPGSPPERMAYMLGDARVRLAVGHGEFGSAVKAISPEDLDVLAADASPAPWRGERSGASLAYVIYTSGSTGRPRGVGLTHEGLANLARWHRSAHELSPADRTTLLAGVGFDASVWEMWGSLTSGASLHVVPADIVLAGQGLWTWLAERGTTVSFLPTPLAEALLETTEPTDHLLRRLLVGGDRLHRGLSGRRFGLWNHYGPTEATVVTTWGPAESSDLPPVGRPIDNFRCYVVDPSGALSLPGTVGELYVGGPGLCRGYVGRPDVTAWHLVPDRWSGQPGARAYRTGDLVRWLESGELSFVGRRDEQVKVRGYRIELGEIESVLLEHSAVEEASALVEGGRLIAFWVARNGSAVGAAELRELAAKRLPDYMIPTSFVALDAMPITQNGKLARRSLAARAASMVSAERPFEAPRSPLEEELAALCGEVLGVDRLGIRDNFFELGGDSLRLVRAVSRVRDSFGVEIAPDQLFKDPTVAGLSLAVGRALVAQAQELEHGTGADEGRGPGG